MPLGVAQDRPRRPLLLSFIYIERGIGNRKYKDISAAPYHRSMSVVAALSPFFFFLIVCPLYYVWPVVFKPPERQREALDGKKGTED